MSCTLAGLNEDIEKFIYKFVNQKNYNFSSFCEIWKEMEFPSIYSGRPTVVEMKYFTRELLLLTKARALPDYTVWERSAAIFLLHALYFIQPLSKKVPIRVELDEWIKLRQFADEMKTINNEVSYCFYKLLVNNAFDFVYKNKAFNIESMKDDDPVPKKESQAKHTKYKYDKFAMGKLLTSIDFDSVAWTEREGKYNEIKQILNQKFPDICNLEIRRFAVNVLIPTVEKTEDIVKDRAIPGTSNSKRVNRKKALSDLLLYSAKEEEENIFESTLSMPLLKNDDEEDDDDDSIELDTDELNYESDDDD